MPVLERFPQPLDADELGQATRILEQGRIRLQQSEQGAIRATVHENRVKLTTRLVWWPDFRWECSCEKAQGSRPCRHVLATALLADRQGAVPVEPGTSRETRPRRGLERPAMWLSASGQLRRIDVDEPRPVVEHRPSPPSWKKQLAKVRELSQRQDDAAEVAWPRDRQLLYVLDVPASVEQQSLVIRLACRDRRARGEWSRVKARGIPFPELACLHDPADRQILALLRGLGATGTVQRTCDPSYDVPPTLRRTVAEMICRTGRALLRTDAVLEETHPLRWEEGPAWELHLEARAEESIQQYLLSGWLVRGEDRLPIARPLLALAGGVVVFEDRAAALDDFGADAWIAPLRSHRSITVPFAQAEELLADLLSMPRLPKLRLPPELSVEELRQAPRPQVRVRAPRSDEPRPDRLRAELLFDYMGTLIAHDDANHGSFFDAQKRRIVHRDRSAELQAARRLIELGMRPAGPGGAGEFWFRHSLLSGIVSALANEGWRVEADGRLYRRAGAMRLKISSGIDWFELQGSADFGDTSVSLPTILAALRRGETTVRLDDGSVGILPEEWLRRYGLVAAMGTAAEDSVRFAKNQAGLLDAMLAGQPEASWDEGFERVQEQLRTFEGVQPLDAPAGFVGQLRGYQRQGLGWFEFLRRFGFGGCLADDMGLGKTVQVLALLESRRAQGNGGAILPSLVVVPRSLVFNWLAEARRFTPRLRIVDHTGIERARETHRLMDYDVVLTTYGTLRRDAALLKDVRFDYVILDEAQAVKNPGSESAKAVRLINADHRLVLSGTPVQNHLGDLWSIFDFLNPGMLGGVSAFASTQGSLRNPDAQTRSVLSRMLRPFILRRTKEQVAMDLPPKLEQTIFCELEAEQRKLYEDLKAYYRQSLLEQVDRAGLNKSRMQILEALLRLRQAALHPGLLDEKRAAESSAKLDVLLPMLEEVAEEGHKALVFSQFTSMLAILRRRLDAEGIAYEYLDGQTRDRATPVTRFQSDGNCRLFLISLKAGGLGLNLTAADYVFLLDPWWNPAVETQAIDRTHRIGQTRQVYACRLIAKDTVEEKVLSLQSLKRELADAIITADNSLLRNLGREDLELLLS